MGGPGSGGKKKISTLTREAMDSDRENLPAYFAKLSERALNGDKECLIYLIDRHLGKAKQTVDSNIKASRVYSAEELRLMAGPMIDESRLLAEWEGEENVQVQREAEGIQQGKDEESPPG